MLNEEIHLIFRGKVQGVGFRATAKKIADKLHLTGYAKNLSDGTVEIYAQGAHQQLNQLVEQLHSIFGRNKISLVSQSFHPIHTAWKTFQIQ